MNGATIKSGLLFSVWRCMYGLHRKK